MPSDTPLSAQSDDLPFGLEKVAARAAEWGLASEQVIQRCLAAERREEVQGNRVRALEAERDRLLALITDGDALWDAFYPHITESGPDLNGSDCHEIARWFRANLDGGDPS